MSLRVKPDFQKVLSSAIAGLTGQFEIISFRE